MEGIDPADVAIRSRSLFDSGGLSRSERDTEIAPVLRGLNCLNRARAMFRFLDLALDRAAIASVADTFLQTPSGSSEASARSKRSRPVQAIAPRIASRDPKNMRFELFDAPKFPKPVWEDLRQMRPRNAALSSMKSADCVWLSNFGGSSGFLGARPQPRKTLSNQFTMAVALSTLSSTRRRSS